jgi:hypothetical protein
MASYTTHVTDGGTTVLETTCKGSCKRPYRIDEFHPEYDAVKDALDRGDRSVIRCYHRSHS